MNYRKSFDFLKRIKLLSTHGPWLLLCQAALVLVKGLFKMSKLSWIRWISHDIYTLDLLIFLILRYQITYCPPWELSALAWPLSLGFQSNKFFQFCHRISSLPLSALSSSMEAANMNRHLMSLIISRQKNCTRSPHSVPTWEGGCLIDEIIIRLNRSDSLV